MYQGSPPPPPPTLQNWSQPRLIRNDVRVDAVVPTQSLTFYDLTTLPDSGTAIDSDLCSCPIQKLGAGI